MTVFEKIFLLLNIILIGVIIFLLIKFKEKFKLKSNRTDNKDIKYNKLVKLLPQMVFEANENGEFRFINDFGLNFISYNKFSIENGLSLFDLVIDSEHKRLEEMLSYTKVGGLNNGQDFFIKSGNGEFLPINLFLSSDFNDDGDLEFRGLIIDAEDQKNWENKVISAILETEDKERKRFSEDLHDGLGPLLSTIKLYVSRASKTCNCSQETRKTLNYATDLIEEAIASTKQISNNILPSAIEDNGLVAAIEDFFSRLRRISDINLIFNPKINNEIPKSVEKTLYRIVYELVNNTIKHSNAKLIRLNLIGDQYKLSLKYFEDGKGFEPKDINHGMGLKNIDNRAISIGAKYSFKTVPGKGVSFELVLNF